MHVYGGTMATVTYLLEKASSFQVQDRTGLTGRYDFLIPVPDQPPTAAGGTDQSQDRESMAIQIADELGLRLQSSKGTLETLVIDHIEQPSEN